MIRLGIHLVVFFGDFLFIWDVLAFKRKFWWFFESADYWGYFLSLSTSFSWIDQLPHQSVKYTLIIEIFLYQECQTPKKITLHGQNSNQNLENVWYHIVWNSSRLLIFLYKIFCVNFFWFFLIYFYLFFVKKEVRNAAKAHRALIRDSPYVPRTLQM
jgi:hypothetical protein